METTDNTRTGDEETGIHLEKNTNTIDEELKNPLVKNVEAGREKENKGRCNTLLCFIKKYGILAVIILNLLSVIILHTTTIHHITPDMSPAPDTYNLQSDKSSTAWLCIYNTEESYLGTLADNLDEYCKLKSYDTQGFVVKMFHCPGTDSYIPLACKCDSKVQCPEGNKEDSYIKENCTVCRDEDHCPCQNAGICKDCPLLFSTGSDIECECKAGTVGKYCTKITQRFCRIADGIVGLRQCNETNNPQCLLTTRDQTLLCSLADGPSGLLNDCLTNYIPLKSTASPASFKDGKSDEIGTNYKFFAVKALLWIAFSVGIVVFVVVYFAERREKACV